MNDISSRIAGLIAKHLNGELNEQERIELDAWAQESAIYQATLDKLTNEKLLFTAVQQSYTNEEQIYNLIKERMLGDQGSTAKVVGMRRYVWVKITAAAAVVILLSLGAYRWFNGRQHKEVIITSNQTETNSHDINPGKEGAILQLADGKQIVLDNSADGSLARQGGTDVVKQGSALQYNKSRTNTTEVVYNTLSTPRGRQFQLVLPDGSKAYLNSASSITFPTAFTGKERSVKIQGEVFMEVEKDKSRPFLVSTKGMQLEVLGTDFNINSYDDESDIKTTLLEGKVKVIAEGNSSQVTVLAPGQQAQLQKQSGQLKKTTDINVEQVVAWKNGLFQFDNDDLASVMRQISRWYDAEVVYAGDIPKGSYGGKIWRSSNLSEVLAILESKDVHFKIEGKKIIVTK